MPTSFGTYHRTKKRKGLGIRKSILRKDDLAEIKTRISLLNEQSERKWGKMSSAQMLRHCDCIIQISTGKIILPKINFILKGIGIITKIEMRLFNNGILPSMPTFKCVIVKENCNFEKSKMELLSSLDDFIEKAKKNNVLSKHELFGAMTVEDWGFMHYKHLNHHLKQFGL